MFNVTSAYSDKSVVTVTDCEISLIMLNTGKLFPFNTGLLVIFCSRKHFQMHKKYNNIILTFALISAQFYIFAIAAL